MKNEPTPQQAPGAQPTGRHQYEHVAPTVIHDPERDMMFLDRWVHRASKDPVKLWGFLAAAAVAVLIVVIVYNVVGGGESASTLAWNGLDSARSADDKLDVAKAHPNSPAAPWARLDAATQLYQSGVADLPSNSDSALQTLKKAADLFEQIAKSEPKDSMTAVTAAFGLARCLEARNELPKAVEQYELVAKTWPDSAQAAEAKKLAAVLQKPDAATFYKDLYAFKPTKVSLPPLGTENLDFPDVVPAPPPPPAPAESLIPPPPPSSQPEEPKAEEPKAEEPKAEEPKAEEPKAEEPKAEAEEAKPAEEPKAEEAKPAEAPKS